MTGVAGDAGALLGRLLLAAIFLHEAVAKLLAYPAAAAYADSHGVPALLLPAAVALEGGGSLLVLLGWRTRTASLLLAGFCLATAVLFHARFDDRGQLLHFEKNLAIAGGFLMLWAHGPGRWTVAALRRR